MIRSPLQTAIFEEQVEVVSQLIKRGDDVNAKDRRNQHTPLHYAVMTRNVGIMKLLLAANAKMDALDAFGDTPLHIAAGTGNLTMVKLLIDAGAKVDGACKRFCHTPLHNAIGWGNSSVVKLLIHSGADVNAKDCHGKTALHKAVELGNENIFKLLVNSGASPNNRDNEGRTPLHCAVSLNNVNLLQRLLDNGASLNLKDNRRLTPLEMAVRPWSGNIFDHLMGSIKDKRKRSDKLREVFKWFVETFFVNKTEIQPKEAVNFESLVKYVDVNAANSSGKNVLNELLKSDSFSVCLLFGDILKHVAIVNALNLPVDPSLIKTIKSKPDLDGLFMDYTKELEKAKKNKITNCWITYFNLLVDGKYKLIKYAGNEDLVNVFLIFSYDHQLEKEFPNYYKQITKNVSDGMDGRNTFDDAASILTYYLKIFSPTHLIIRDILDYLTEQEWLYLRFG